MRRALVLVLLLGMAAPVQAAEPEPFGRGSFRQLRESHAGQPLAVHFWALSCAPCLEELPRWAQLIRRYPNFRIVLVNTDPPEADRQVARALERAGLSRARNMVFADRVTARLRFEVDPDWRGELPRTDLVSRAGEVTPVIGVLPAAELERWLRAQSAQPQGAPVRGGGAG